MNLLLYITQDSLMAYVNINMKTAVRLNSILYSRRRNLDAVFLINALKDKLVARLFWILTVRMPTACYSSPHCAHNFKVISSTGCVSAGNEVSRCTGSFEKDRIFLNDTSL